MLDIEQTRMFETRLLSHYHHHYHHHRHHNYTNSSTNYTSKYDSATIIATNSSSSSWMYGLLAIYSVLCITVLFLVRARYIKDSILLVQQSCSQENHQDDCAAEDTHNIGSDSDSELNATTSHESDESSTQPTLSKHVAKLPTTPKSANVNNNNSYDSRDDEEEILQDRQTTTLSTSIQPHHNIDFANLEMHEDPLITAYPQSTFFDYETWQVAKLSTSLCATAAMEPLMELSVTAMMDAWLGDDAVDAYLTSRMVIHMTSFVCEGLVKAQYTFCAQAIGQSNHYLAGRYVHIALLTEWILGLFVYLPLWYNAMEHILLYIFKFDPVVANLGRQYAQIYGFNRLLMISRDTYESLLDIDGHEDYNTKMDALQGITMVTIIATFGKLFPHHLTITIIGLVELCVYITFTILHVTYAKRQGWLHHFWSGMTCRWSYNSDIITTKSLLNNALIISVGRSLEKFKVEILSIFVASGGSRQFAAWIILDTLWDFLEAIPIGISKACQIRVAHHSGQKAHAKAQHATYCSLKLGLVLSFLASILVLIFSPSLPSWFTSDQQTRQLILAALPLILYGNIAETFASVFSYTVEAKKYFKLMTAVELVVSGCLTIPLSAIMVYVWHMGLAGVATTIVIGFFTSGTIFASFLMVSSSHQQLSDLAVEHYYPTKSESDFVISTTTRVGVDELELAERFA